MNAYKEAEARCQAEFDKCIASLDRTIAKCDEIESKLDEIKTLLQYNPLKELLNKMKQK